MSFPALIYRGSARQPLGAVDVDLLGLDPVGRMAGELPCLLAAADDDVGPGAEDLGFQRPRRVGGREVEHSQDVVPNRRVVDEGRLLGAGRAAGSGHRLERAVRLLEVDLEVVVVGSGPVEADLQQPRVIGVGDRELLVDVVTRLRGLAVRPRLCLGSARYATPGMRCSCDDRPGGGVHMPLERARGGDLASTCRGRRGTGSSDPLLASWSSTSGRVGGPVAERQHVRRLRHERLAQPQLGAGRPGTR